MYIRGYAHLSISLFQECHDADGDDDGVNLINLGAENENSREDVQRDT